MNNTPCNCAYHTANRILNAEGEFNRDVAGTHFWLSGRLVSAADVIKGVR